MFSSLCKKWHAIKYWPHYMWAVFRFTGYKPQPVTLAQTAQWLSQFDERDRRAVLRLLRQVTYLSEKQTESFLIQLNQRLLEKLAKDGITLKNVIYVQLHDPGSSSAVILSMLRDRARLERSGCYFIDSKNVRELNEVTTKLEQGAILYIAIVKLLHRAASSQPLAALPF